MAIASFDQVKKGMVDAYFVDKYAPGTTPYVPLALVLPPASGGTFNTGITQEELNSVNCRGEIVVAARYTKENKPTIELEFSQSPEVLMMALNRRAKVTSSPSGITYARSAFEVPASGLVAAAPAGTLGNGVAADVASINASYQNTAGFSIKITQGTFSSFNATTTPLGFAIGADGAMKFGDTLKGRPVSFEYPVTVSSVTELGTNLLTLGLQLSFVTLQQQIFKLIIPNVSVDASGSIPLAEGKLNLKFNIEGDYNLQYLGMLNPC